MGILKDIFNFLLPQHCVMCGNRLSVDEQDICVSCRMHLPFTHLQQVPHNQMERLFWTQFPIKQATALFYHDGPHVRHLIHTMKYGNRPMVGMHLAESFAAQLKGVGFFDDIDCIVPIPLHWRRQLNRHYNQSHYIAEGISRATSLPVYTRVVARKVDTVSQTRVMASERRQNVEGIFCLKDARKIAGKHILLVDDVTTTGSTLTSCAKELARAEGVRISVLTLSLAGQTPVPVSPDTGN